ncbi:MAG: hypothetical protein O2983_12250, partial [Planctomycetota bacterium]|nr:hypothetical protein [Planctomycetota bacterium]
MTTFFKLPCPHCSKSLKVSQDLAGQSRTCPYCKGTVKIPEPAAPEPESVFPNIVVNTGASALGTGIPSAGTAPQATTTQKSPAP